MPKGVVIPPSFYEALQPLEPLDRLSVLEAVLEYGLYGAVPDLPPLQSSLFKLMQPIIDSSQRRYAAAVENGKKGGAPKGNQNASKKKQPVEQPKINQDIDSDLDSDIDSEKENERESLEGGGERRFSPLSDQQQYEAEKARTRDRWIETLATMKERRT